jgi:hypothetical protein
MSMSRLSRMANHAGPVRGMIQESIQTKTLNCCFGWKLIALMHESGWTCRWKLFGMWATGKSKSSCRSAELGAFTSAYNWHSSLLLLAANYFACLKPQRRWICLHQGVDKFMKHWQIGCETLGWTSLQRGCGGATSFRSGQVGQLSLPGSTWLNTLQRVCKVNKEKMPLGLQRRNRDSVTQSAQFDQCISQCIWVILNLILAFFGADLLGEANLPASNPQDAWCVNATPLVTLITSIG